MEVMEKERAINEASSEVNNIVPVIFETTEVIIGLENDVIDNGTGGGGGGLDVSGLGDASAKRKRGRPKKHKEPLPSNFSVVTEYSPAPPQKRGRGRPKGSGKWQRANSLGSAQIGTAGSNFAASTINLQTGEDIYQTMRLYSQRTLDSLCILSASGSVSSAVLHHDGLQGRNATYEGCFDIVSLSGTYVYTEQGLRHGKNCTMSVHLVNNQDGQYLGGVVVGPLIASGPIQLILGTFREHMMMRHRVERPKPTKPVVDAVPLQAINGSTLPVPGVNGVAAVPPVPTSLGEESGELIDGPDVITASQQHAPPVDDSDEAMNGPDVNNVAVVPPVPAPLGEESGKLIDSPDGITTSQQHTPPVDESDEAINGPDVNGVAAVPPKSAPLGEESSKLIDSPDVITASQQHTPPVDESDEAMYGLDVNPGGLNHQTPPVDDVDRVEMGPDVIPASPQTADSNSLQPSVNEKNESERVVFDPDLGATGQ